MESTRDNPRVQLASIRAPQPVRRVRGLDGMRALACAAVLAYHLLPGTLVGGFLGVDVFFVLSGFLITALLLREWRNRCHIDLRSFWLRRIRRLLPAVTVMALVTLIVAGLVDHDLLAGIVPQFFGVITFAYNWVEIGLGASYFDTANPHLWTNVWSLAVEQQFYLLWPLVVIVIVGLHRRWRWLIPALLALISLSWMAWLISGAEDYTRAYQGTDSHAFGLMLGALLATVARDPLVQVETCAPRRVAWMRGLIAWVSLAVVIAGWIVIPDSQAWVYPWGTLAICLAMVGFMQAMLPRVDEAGGPGHLLANLLDTRVLVWLGERSYGIYLWHWPLAVIITHLHPQLPVWQSAIYITALSIVAAHLSYRWVEVPMRYRGIGATLRSWSGPRLFVATGSGTYRRAGLRDGLRIALPTTAMLAFLALASQQLIAAPTQTEAERLVAAGTTAITAEPTPAATPSTQPSPEPTITTTPTAAPTPGPKSAPTGEHVSVIGDSVTVAAASALQEQLPGVAIDAAV
ncbi:MAG: acyltransferase family protein, partial [Bowdeniella nasicola]|nr:acyltransferase family protein [Bowdeniella nasicola]